MNNLEQKKSFEEIKSLIREKHGTSLTISDQDVFLIAGFINEMGLSFFGNDFYIIPIGAKNQIVTSIEGIRKVARGMGAYSIEFKYINENFEIAEFPNSKKPNIIQAILTFGSQTFKKEILFSEYTTGRNLWLSKPFVMLQKVAESSVLRMAFNLGGMYIAEEFGANETPKPVSDLLAKKKEIMKILTENGVLKEEAGKFIETAKEQIGISEVKTIEDCEALLCYISEYNFDVKEDLFENFEEYKD